MKIFTSLKFAVTALLLTAGMNVMATEITFDATADKAADATATSAQSIEKEGITLAISGGMLGNGTEYRIYKSQKLTVSSTVGAIAKIEFTCTASGTSKWGPGCFTVEEGEYSYDDKIGTWTGAAEEVVFTASTNQVRATTIVVTLAGGDVVIIAKPVITPESGTYNEAQTVTITAEEGLDIYYIVNDGEVQNYAVPFTIEETSTIVAWAENEDGVQSAKTTVEIKIVAGLTLTGEGTVENPYTVADALAIIAAGAYTNDKVYIKGVITQVGIEKEGAMTDLPGNSFGNATYFIADAADSETSLEVYRGYDFKGDKFTSEDDIKVGDEIIVYGALTLYKETPEVAQNSQIYMLNGETEREKQPVDPVTTVGDGSQENPFTVADVLALYAASQAPEGKVWTIGYIVAYVQGTTYGEDKVIFDLPEDEQTEIVLADAVEETDYTKTLPVQLPAGTIREKLDIFANQSLFHKQALVYGSIEKYFSVAGVKSVTDAIVDGVSVGINQVNAPEVVAMGIYTVAGQKVQNVTRGGLYIIGGKKVMVK